jgi:hypothetical protein
LRTSPISLLRPLPEAAPLKGRRPVAHLFLNRHPAPRVVASTYLAPQGAPRNSRGEARAAALVGRCLRSIATFSRI